MSSKVQRVNKKIVEQRLTTVVQVLSIVEEESKERNFFARFIISCQYLFTGKIDVFFKVGKANGK